MNQFLKNSVFQKFFFFNNLNSLKQEKMVRAAIKIYLAIMLLIIIFLIFTWKRLPPELPLFYSLPWGEEQLGKPIFILVLILVYLGLGILNFSLAVFSYGRSPLAAKILVWVTVLAASLVSLTLFKIIFLII